MQNIFPPYMLLKLSYLGLYPTIRNIASLYRIKYYLYNIKHTFRYNSYLNLKI